MSGKQSNGYSRIDNSWCLPAPMPAGALTRIKRPARWASLGLFYFAGVTRQRKWKGKEIRRILLIRPDHLGDVLLSFPALELLRRSFPDAEISLAVGPWSEQIASYSPDINEVISVSFPGFQRLTGDAPLDPYRLLVRTANALRDRNFDVAIVLRNDFWWGAVLAYLAAIPMRYGYQTVESRPFLTTALPFPEGRHVTDQSLELVQRLIADLRPPISPATWRFNPVLTLRDEDIDSARAMLASGGISHAEPYAAIHPGAGADIKLWTSEGFGEIVRYLIDQRGLKIVVTGSKSECSLVSEVIKASGRQVFDLAGQTGLGTLGAVLGMAKVAVGVDSGPMHMAVAGGAPTIHIFGPSDPVLFGPRGTSGRNIVVASSVACVPCCDLSTRTVPGRGGACMQAVSVAEVIEAIETAIGKPGR